MSPNLLQLTAYFTTLALFGVFGLLLNLVCVLCAWLPRTVRVERFFQRVIHHHFAIFLRWLRWLRICDVQFEGFEKIPARTGLVIVANHPGLMDAVYVLARVPEAFCIFKPAVRRNPVLGGSAVRAGYIGNTNPLELVRAASAKLRAGQPLVIFPEGTRTPSGTTLLPLKPGFALIACKAGVPVQLVQITGDVHLLGKGRPWWQPVRMPSHVRVVVGPQIATAGKTPAQVVAETDAWLRAQLVAPATSVREPVIALAAPSSP